MVWSCCKLKKLNASVLLAKSYIKLDQSCVIYAVEKLCSTIKWAIFQSVSQVCLLLLCFYFISCMKFILIFQQFDFGVIDILAVELSQMGMVFRLFYL